MIVEAQLDWYGLDYELETIGDLFESAAAREALAEINPVAQIPTLVLDDGAVLTESAAITLYLADLTQRTDLVAGPSEAERAAFLRWLIFLVANIYPTYTYADDPARFVSDAAAQDDFRAHVDDYAQKLYGDLDAAAGSPWFLGDRFSALDLYICAMTHWRPRRQWFAANTPQLHRIAVATEALDAVRPCFARNYLDSASN